MCETPESPADLLVRSLASRAGTLTVDEVLGAPEARTVDSFDPAVLQKAWWCYRKVVESRDCLPRDRFLEGYRRSFAKFYLEAARALAGRAEVPAIDLRLPQVLWIFHFPEYPRLAGLLRSADIVVLVKRHAPWMGNGRFLSIEDVASLREILDHLGSGGTIVAMADHALPNTYNRAVEFLGRRCMTPMGLFAIASRASLSMGLLLPSPGAWAIVPFETGPGVPPELLATAVLGRLSDHILSTPERWLLWPNLNHRWIDAY